MKKVYIASRFGRRDEVKVLAHMLEKIGYTFPGDWTDHFDVKPYEGHVELTQQYAYEDIEAARGCDVFVILSDESGTGMYVEFGAALAAHQACGTPEIYVVGEYRARSSFYFHPAVHQVRTTDELINMLVKK